MYRTLAALIVLLVAAFSPLAAQQPPQLDPALRQLLRAEVRGAVRGAPETGPDRPAFDPARPRARSVRPHPGGIAVDTRGGPSGPEVGVLVELREPVAAAVAALRREGAEVGAVVGTIATARVPLAALERVSRLGEIERIDAARIRTLETDRSIAAIRADEARRHDGGFWLGAAGYGVLVGVYDTGIDFRHEDFRDPTGESRLLGVWDQTASGEPPTGYTYGVYCDSLSLAERSCSQRDVNGHGTHVAGTAAGSGAARGSGGTAYRYAGVAPAASLLVVKGGDDHFSDDRIVDGVAWIFETAERLGRPAVVNLSLGGQYGPRDGTSLLEQALDALSGPGRIVVVAAGNSGDNQNTAPATESFRIHGMATATAGVGVDFQIEVPPYSPAFGSCNDEAWIDLWSPAEDRLELTVVRPDGTFVTAAHGERVTQNSASGQVYIDHASGGPDARNGDFESLVVLSDCGTSGHPEPGTWTLRVTPTLAASDRPYHLWITWSQLGTGWTQAHGVSDNFTNSHTVGSPGTAREAVTVGAFVTRLCWPVAGGNVCWQEREAEGDIAYFSSAGPTRDGRLKPEITAPGRSILSTLSRHASPPAQLIGPDGEHVILQGTSMAAPHVTGTIALLLQHEPALTPADVKQVLQRTAVQDRFTTHTYSDEPDGVPNTLWGYGKLDAKAALEEVPPPEPATLVVRPEALPAPAVTASRAGTRLSLLRLRLHVEGDEAVRLLSLGVTARGDDSRARVLLLRDEAAAIGGAPAESVLAEAEAALRAGSPQAVSFVPAPLRLQPADTLSLVVAIELSGDVPNATTFQVAYEPELLRVVGLRSGAGDLTDQPGTPIASAPVVTDLLDDGEVFALSENPVRSASVIFNFRERPRVAAVYTVTGQRVVDLLPRLDTDGRVEWDLRNDRGSPVAPGVYLTVFDIGGTLVRERLIIVRPAGTREDEP